MHGLGTSQVFLLLSLLIYTFFAPIGSAAAINQLTSNGVSKTVVGDVTVYIDQSSFQCDRIFCPPDTDRCQVTKFKAIENATELIRDNLCLAANNSALISERFIDNIAANEYDDLNLIVSSTGSSVITNSGNGRQLTPEEAEELNKRIAENIQRTQETLRMNLEKAREAINKAFSSFGNFGNLGNFGNFGGVRFW
ncbi:uncharacterized protein [Eurosta solidaginis]|uniref:uncharacterized protein n=1 Tax=Eurosta solidaginis TaxID=178769 RepID=UPI003530A6E9